MERTIFIAKAFMKKNVFIIFAHYFYFCVKLRKNTYAPTIKYGFITRQIQQI